MAFNQYIKKGGREYRLGYTTGTTAAGAAKAAAQMLAGQLQVKEVFIDTPAGIRVEMKVVAAAFAENKASASIIKDAGDDPDVTDGLKITAEVKRIKKNNEIKKTELLITGGEGIGKVTKPGLQLDIGQAAINPVPREMIKKAVLDILPEHNQLEVIVSAPKALEIAAKTFNPKLGIKGGISILGNTGIVEPMSESAYKDSLALELKQGFSLGIKKFVFVFGNHGKNKALELGFDSKQIIRMSNFVGFMLEQAAEFKIEEIIIIGHIGKIVKIAGGIFNTHSKIADARREILAAHAALIGAEQKIIKNIFDLNTAEEAADYLLSKNLEQVLNNIAEAVAVKTAERLENKIKVKAVVFSFNQGIIALSKDAEEDFEIE